MTKEEMLAQCKLPLIEQPEVARVQFMRPKTQSELLIEWLAATGVGPGVNHLFHDDRKRPLEEGTVRGVFQVPCVLTGLRVSLPPTDCKLRLMIGEGPNLLVDRTIIFEEMLNAAKRSIHAWIFEKPFLVLPGHAADLELISESIEIAAGRSRIAEATIFGWELLREQVAELADMPEIRRLS